MKNADGFAVNGSSSAENFFAVSTGGSKSDSSDHSNDELVPELGSADSVNQPDVIAVERDETSIMVNKFIVEMNARIESQRANREILSSKKPLTDAQLRQMDSTLKKTTAFTKKLKNIGSTQQSAICADIEKINLSKFLEEIAAIIAEMKIKFLDIPSVVEISVRLASYYAEFSSLLLSEFRKILPLKRSDKINNPSKLRVDLRLFCELCLNGVFAKEGIQTLGSATSYLTQTDKTKFLNVPILLPFLKAFNVDLMGVYPLAVVQAASSLNINLPQSTFITVDEKKSFAQLFFDYRKSFDEHVRNVLAELNKLLRSIKRQTRSRGDASADDHNRLKEIRANYEKDLQNLKQISELLGMEMQQMIEEESEDEDEKISAQALNRALQEGTVSIWPDEDTRQFYESKIDLKQMIPAISFQESAQRTLELIDRKMEDVDFIGSEDVPEGDEGENEQSDAADEEDSNEEGSSVDLQVAADPPKVSGQDQKLMMNAFLEKLPWLINRDMIDKAAFEFATQLNNKTNRKKLCQMILKQNRSRVDLLPFYSRFIATLEPIMPDLALGISHELLRQFRITVENNSKLPINTKIRCCKFISELVKFGIIPRAEAIFCLRTVLFNFKGQNIDMCCAMIDSMGMYLYRSVDSHGKMLVMLDVMMKKRERLKDARTRMLIDNAYYACVPPPQKHELQSTRPAIHEFIRNQIINLSKFRLDMTMRFFRKLDWTNADIVDYVSRVLSTPSLTKISSLLHVASLISELRSYHYFIGVQVLDAVLENIRHGLEYNNSKLNQEMVLNVVFLGELYNFSVCESSIVFKTLYQFITFGAFDPLFDDWDNVTRIVLVCELLLTCGEYFGEGRAKTKLDCFLAYFFRYYLRKSDLWTANSVPFPNEIKFRVEEMTEYVRKGKKIPKTVDDAEQAVNKIQCQYKKKVEAVLTGEPNGCQNLEFEEEEEVEERKQPKFTYLKTELEVIGEEGTESSSSGEAESLSRVDVEENNDHKRRFVLLEDERIANDLDQMIAETMHIRPTMMNSTLSEIKMPKNRDQEFVSAIEFGNFFIKIKDKRIFEVKFIKSYNSLPEQNHGSCAESIIDGDTSTQQQPMKVAILVRGKDNKPDYKSIAMEAPAGLAKSWHSEIEKMRKERIEHKHNTLWRSDMMLEEEEEKDVSPQ